MKTACYPFSAIVGQGLMKTALLLNAIDHSLGGVLIRGHQGTGKSTAARALARLLPELEVVAGCMFHCDPELSDQSCEHCSARRAAGGKLLRAQAPMPLVDLPPNASEARLIGELREGGELPSAERRFDPGLLAEANRGILFVDEVNLLDDHLVGPLLDVAASGVNVVERAGVSFSHPSRFILVGSMNPDEGELRSRLLDRFALCVSVEGLPDHLQRKQLVRRRLAFEADPKAFCRGFSPADSELSHRIARAREALGEVAVPIEVLELAVLLATELGARGHRAEIIMIKAARALAAFSGRQQVERADINAVGPLVLLHRLPGAPQQAPQELLARVEAAIQRLAPGEPTVQVLLPADEEFDELTDRIQLPGSVFARLEKK